MKTITVLTPSNIEIEYRLAGAGSRLAAFVIDFLLQIIFCLLLAFAILFGIYDFQYITIHLEGYPLALVIISWFLVYFCYFIFSEMLMNGQSVGKRIFGLRVIRDNGQPINLSQSMVRNLFRAVLDIIYIGLFCIMFSKKNKRIGDMVAGTVVVAEHYEGLGLSPHLIKPRKAIREQLTNLTLTDYERNLLYLYLTRKIYLPDEGEALERQWAEYLSQKWQIDAALIDDSLLSELFHQ